MQQPQQVVRWLVWLGAVTVAAGWLTAGAPLALAAGASLKISPGSGTYEVGGLIDVAFVLDTGGEAVNAVKADIVFPADKLQIVNPAASTSFISVWLTAPTFSNADGTLNFQGGLPNPGINTSSGFISTVTFRVKSAGKAVVRYLPSSLVLRNDPDGTNILTSSGTAEFTLKTPPPAGPVVSSPTHGDPNQWYNIPQAQFSWEPVDGAVGYSYAFDQAAKQAPDTTVDTTATSATVEATADGVWYFHVRAFTTAWGGATTFPVQIDRTPPASFTPKLDSDLLTTEESGTVRFITTDGASGLDHYEVKQVARAGSSAPGNTLFVEITSPYVTPKLPDGEYEFIVRAFDRAGNVTEGSAVLTIVAGGIPFYARVPFLRNPAVANTVFIVLGALVVLSLGYWIYRRLRLRATFQHDLLALERDAQKKARALQQELSELHQAEQYFHDELKSPPPSFIPPASPPGPPPSSTSPGPRP
ncbi:MAG: hypothetical protein HY567_03800 [Candidatus Kerfeldbacteria bacterium]|nr:hypothetical protein [Candidatus Kerfeldbacteria bacterium]